MPQHSTPGHAAHSPPKLSAAQACCDHQLPGGRHISPAVSPLLQRVCRRGEYLPLTTAARVRSGMTTQKRVLHTQFPLAGGAYNYISMSLVSGRLCARLVSCASSSQSRPCLCANALDAHVLVLACCRESLPPGWS